MPFLFVCRRARAPLFHFFHTVATHKDESFHTNTSAPPPHIQSQTKKQPQKKRFSAWTKGACAASEPCVEAQTNTDLTVDAAALRALLAGRMPLVAAGAGVADAELPWPPEL
jgi:hypothetical protein